jgi:hypothetical protein
MVLHLLGKKSWNVYNADNVERVRRDEAHAKAREEAEEQRMQEEDAARRLAILRGEASAPAALTGSSERPEAIDRAVHKGGADGIGPQAAVGSRAADAGGGSFARERKRRRLRGEDDTDRDIRYAREDAEAGEKARKAFMKKSDEDASLVDHAGHLQLIPAPDEKALRKAKDAEAEAENGKKRRREEGLVNMKFSDAAGYNNSVTSKPWYASNKHAEKQAEDRKALMLPGVQEKDAWGNEDPRRKERERNRVSTNDPFAAMQQAQRQLKQSERDKAKWEKERAAELDELKRAEEKRRHRDRRHRRLEEEDELEGFSLDAPAESRQERSDHDRGRRHRHHRHHRHRSRSRSRDRHSEHRHRHRSRDD